MLIEANILCNCGGNGPGIYNMKFSKLGVWQNKDGHCRYLGIYEVKAIFNQKTAYLWINTLYINYIYME